MKQRFRIGKDGALIGRDGDVYGYVSSITLDLNPGVGERSPLSLENDNDKTTTPSPRQEISMAVDVVWAHYIEVMQPRSAEIDPQGRGVIRDALAVAKGESLEEKIAELNRAIDGCKMSTFHMGENERRRKYNRITQILKGKVGGKTTREQIDMFLDIAAEAESRARGESNGLSTSRISHLKDAITTFVQTGAEHERALRARDLLIETGTYSDVVFDRTSGKAVYVQA